MRRTFPLLLAPVLFFSLAVGSVILEAPSERLSLDPSSLEASCEAQTLVQSAGFMSAREEEEDERKEAPAVSSVKKATIEAAIWGHLAEEMWWHYGVFRTSHLPGRKLIPVWIEPPVMVDADRYEVMVEMMAVASVPSDFSSIGEASQPPRLVSRSPEQAVRQQAKTRGPTSWQLTFDVWEVTEEVFKVLDVRVTGRPGDARKPLRISDCKR